MFYKKSLGQHILHGEGILKKIAGALGDIGDEIVVEIGGGTGNLTGFLVNNIFLHTTFSQSSQSVRSSGEPLLISHPADSSLTLGDQSRRGYEACPQKSCIQKNTKKLMVYELDNDLAELLKGKFPDAEIKNENFLQADLAQFKNNYLLIGNIPYFITGQILRKVFTLENYPKIAVFTISKEQGEKFLSVRSAQGKVSGSFWSNWIKVWGKVEKVCTIKASSFFPPPKIDSIAIKINFYKKPIISEPENFVKFLKIIFNRPKQTTVNNLKGAYGNEGVKKFIEELGTLRPHQLTFEQVLKLYGAMTNKRLK